MTWNPNKSIQIVTSTEVLNDLFDRYIESPILAFDCETTGLARFDKAVGISLAISEDEACFIPFEIYSNEHKALIRPWNDEAWSYVKDWIKAQLTASKRLLGHNSSFDCKVLKTTLNLDLIDYIIADTQLLHHTVIDESPPHGLKPLAAKFLTPDAEDAQDDLKQSVLANGGRWVLDDKPFWMGDFNILGRYACYDVLYTMGLYNRFYPKLEQDSELMKLWNEEVMPLLKVTHELNTTGLRVDVSYFEQLKKEMQINIENLEAIIFAEIEDKIRDYELEVVLDKYKITARTALGRHLISVGWNIDDPIEPFHNNILNWYKAHTNSKYILNLDSNEDKGFILFDVLGLPSEETTASGKRKVTSAIIKKLEEQYAEDSQILKLMVQRTKEMKLLSTYVEPVLEKHIDGMFYPSFNQTGTTSGRYSAGGRDTINFQNIPARDKRIKKGFVPKEGMAFVGADYSSLEPRCFSFVSGEPKLIKVFTDGLDFYSQIAIEVLGIEHVSANPKDPHYLGTVMPDVRQDTKSFALSIPYGAEGGRIAQMRNCSYEEGKELVDKYLKGLPDLKKWMDKCAFEMKTQGYVTSLAGRKKRGELVKEVFTKYKVRDFSKRSITNLYSKAREYNQNPNYPTDIGFYLEIRNLLNVGRNHQVQSLAASVINMAMINLQKDLREQTNTGEIVIMVHDSIIVSCSEAEKDLCTKILKKNMEDNEVTRKITVPLIAEPKIGYNLAEV